MPIIYDNIKGFDPAVVERYKGRLRKVPITFYERYGFKGNEIRTPMYLREYETDN